MTETKEVLRTQLIEAIMELTEDECGQLLREIKEINKQDT